MFFFISLLIFIHFIIVPTTFATVDANGKVTPKARGTTIITAKTVDGNKTATCSVIVELGIAVKVVDTSGRAISGAKVSFRGNSSASEQINDVVTDSNGMATFIKPTNFYSTIYGVNATKDGYEVVSYDSKVTYPNNTIIQLTIRSLPSTKPYGKPLSSMPTPSSFFGWRYNNGSLNFHQGVDLPKSSGTEIRCVQDSEVKNNAYASEYGYYIRIKSGSNYIKYQHMREKSSFSIGDKVEIGDPIGYVGDSGSSGAYHLHFDITTYDSISFDQIYYKYYIDPFMYIPKS